MRYRSVNFPCGIRVLISRPAEFAPLSVNMMEDTRKPGTQTWHWCVELLYVDFHGISSSIYIYIYIYYIVEMVVCWKSGSCNCFFFIVDTLVVWNPAEKAKNFLTNLMPSRFSYITAVKFSVTFDSLMNKIFHFMQQKLAFVQL